ncbi:phospholipase [Bacillus taeanensis]|uniref:Phospholipase n=1 Tax=Bacillus taeanensis TaxID=273032 RepID=A0A366XQU1_9BACI|nr:phospholipase [Bacillus taeanensis]RBW67485.1 phospholipase [Bacillus taeanensis]
MWREERRQERFLPGFCVLPGYKWCGPGCSGPGAPVNDVDACCKAHDECYSWYGPSCECDLELIHCLAPKVNPYTKKGRDAALLYHYMNFQKLFTCFFR